MTPLDPSGQRPGSADGSIVATMNGAAVSRTAVRAWESRRARAVIAQFRSRLGARGIAEIAPDMPIQDALVADLETQREYLVALKTGLGHAGIYAMFRRELALAERSARIAVALSRGRSVHSGVHLVAPDCSAAAFAEWFDRLVIANMEREMLRACPDHHLLRGLPDGRQEVIETTGGAPTPTRFLVDYTRSEAVSIPVHPEFPVQISGHAVLDDGMVIGGVRHQFRDRAGSMEALVTVQFPGVLPARMVEAHRWHLATEFSNWIEAFRGGSAI